MSEAPDREDVVPPRRLVLDDLQQEIVERVWGGDLDFDLREDDVAEELAQLGLLELDEPTGWALTPQGIKWLEENR
jgi:hypothetical protein